MSPLSTNYQPCLKEFKKMVQEEVITFGYRVVYLKKKYIKWILMVEWHKKNHQNCIKTDFNGKCLKT